MYNTSYSIWLQAYKRYYRSAINCQKISELSPNRHGIFENSFQSWLKHKHTTFWNWTVIGDIRRVEYEYNTSLYPLSTKKLCRLELQMQTKMQAWIVENRSWTLRTTKIPFTKQRWRFEHPHYDSAELHIRDSVHCIHWPTITTMCVVVVLMYSYLPGRCWFAIGTEVFSKFQILKGRRQKGREKIGTQ